MTQVLGLDDDAAVRLLLEKIVKGMGYAFSSFDNLQDEMAQASKGEYDLILLELDFPEGNLLEILPDLISLPNSPEVIIITGTSDVRGVEIAFNYGAWGYIKKPFLPEDVSLPITHAMQYHEEKAAIKPTVLKRGDIIGESPAILR